MTSRHADVRAAAPADLPVVTELLAGAGLPSADLGPGHMREFLVATRGDSILGAIGLEVCGAVGLLRSLVVRPDSRGAGLGKRLVTAMEQHAVECGVRDLWLLTIDATGYFEQRGYETRARAMAPAAIAATREFASLCPVDAALMRKILRGRARES